MLRRRGGKEIPRKISRFNLAFYPPYHRAMVRPLIDLKVDRIEFLALAVLVFWIRGERIHRMHCSDDGAVIPKEPRRNRKVQNCLVREMLAYMKEEKKMPHPERRLGELLMHLTHVNVG